jgi:Mn-dependent DtxR family transcriptional regulator
MPSKYEGPIYNMLEDEPVTPNEIAKRLEVSHKTAQRVLMQLALTKKDVLYKSSGRIHLFWRKRSR